MEKVYIASAKAGQGQHGGYLKVSFSQADREMMERYANEKGYVTLFISKRREVGTYGQTHTVTVAPPRTDYHPANSNEHPYANVTNVANVAENPLKTQNTAIPDDGDIPF